ncbi:hypothetical protein BDV98DRAFT_160481 [Pterulicium gracile]|uniref:Uncharacterized protein n=1 Tax=Pterulicium gracile TaxID=1884261 RepID=A0A5C3QXN5_9AGAR|nr:hypothetical protein BDV98DRAFT_160481 [Pterula gracilis]
MASNSASTPDSVVILLQTSVLVPHFSKYYEGSIHSFYPNYTPVEDGSLVTDVYLRQLRTSQLAILVHTALFLMFLRNIFVSADYVYSGKIKRKGLLKVLLASQIIAAPIFLVIIIDFFNPSGSCPMLARSALFLNAISMGFLLTGILAVKAYRCLENSKWVLGTCVALRALSTVVSGLSAQHLQATRRLTGGCTVHVEKRLFFIYLILQLLESLFLCACFFFTLWKTRRNPIARGRISLAIHSDDGASFVRSTHTDDSCHPRGWWDYNAKSGSCAHQPLSSPPLKSEGFTPITVPSFLTRLRGVGAPTKREYEIKRTTINPLRRLPFGVLTRNKPRPGSDPDRASAAPSSTFSRLVPRMVLFKQVMKDELLYTAVMSSGCLFFLVLVVLSTQLSFGLQSYHWLFLYWAFVSLLSVHSFGQVVKRHEREALLQHPSAWENSPRPDGLNGRPRFSMSWSATTRSISSPPDDHSDIQNLLQPPTRARSWQSSSTSSSLPSRSISFDAATVSSLRENYSCNMSSPPPCHSPSTSISTMKSRFQSKPDRLDRTAVD